MNHATLQINQSVMWGLILKLSAEYSYAEYIRFRLLFAARYLKQILAAPRNEFVAHIISRLTTVFVVVDKFPLFPCNLVEEKYQTVSHLVLHLFFKSAGKSHKYLLN